jgi:hypothetical protein
MEPVCSRGAFVRTDLSYADIIPSKLAETAGAGGVGADLRALFARWWREAPDFQRFVYVVSFGIFLAGVFHALVWAVLGGSWTETVSWRKPTLFFASSGVTVSTCAFVMGYLKLTRRRGWQLGLCMLTPGFVVGILIALQQWRGTRSHFNFFESEFDSMVAGAIALIISLCVPAAAILAAMTFRSLRPGVSRTLALALRAGTILINVSFLMGLVTIVNGVTNGLLFTIQVPSVIGSAGTTKVAHALPLHGIQTFLLVVGLLSYTKLTERRRLAVLSMVVAGYVGLVAVFVLQSFSGREPFDFSIASIVTLEVSAGLLIAGVGIALATALAGIRNGARSEIIPSYPWAPAASSDLAEPVGLREFFDAAFWKTAAGLVLLVGAFVGTSAGIGLRLSPALVFERTAWIDASPERVWGIVTDHANEPAWRHELTGIWPIPSFDRYEHWQEQYWSHQRIDLDTTEQASRGGQGGRLVRRMSFHALPVLAGGVRIVDVSPEGGGTRITVREEKLVRVPPFRTWARLFVTPQLRSVTADRYVTQLATRLSATPRFE